MYLRYSYIGLNSLLDNTFAVWRNIGFNNVPLLNDVLGFNITYIFSVDNDDAQIVIPPRRRLYQFPDDTWVTSYARQVRENENLIPDNTADGMFNILPEFLISSLEGRVVYRLVNDDMLLQPFNQVEQHFLAVLDGWESYTLETFRRDG
ncbi:hypothetical protein Tco_1511280 [Tanacetum coccineum]